MRCVTCGSIVEKQDPTNRIQCDTAGCGVPLCPESFGAECWATHNKAVHPEKGAMTTGAVRTLIHQLRDKLKASEDRAIFAEGQVSHWMAVNHATDVNWKAKFGALVKWMNVACPEQLDRVERTGLASRADILPEA